MDNSEIAQVNSLLLSIREGDQGSFESLCEQYNPMIMSLIRGMGMERDDAFSDALLALYRAALSFDIEQTEVTFGLYARICVSRRLLDMHRSNGGRAPLDDNFDVERISVDSGIISRLEREEERQRLHSCARRLLSEYEYSVFRLWLRGHRAAEIAEAMEADTKSVENAKARILKKLRDGLSRQRVDE